MTSYAPEQNWSHTQLSASSTAASKNGVPVYLLRGVTGYKYGPTATAAQFSYTAGQLSGWYTHFYKQYGDALIAWTHAAAQEMPGASSETVAAASSYQTVALGTIVSAPLVGIGAALGAAGDAAASAIASTGFDVAGSDVAGSAGGSAAGASAGDTAGAGAGGTTASGAGAGAAATVAKVGAVAGLAGLLGLTGWGELLVRGLEALAGAALILLGLQALTGQGSGSPVQAVRSTRKAFA